MAIWHDPLDDLIADLERAVPAAPASTFDIPPMEDYSVFMEHMLSRDPAKRSRLAEHPAVKRVQAYHGLAPAPPSRGPVKPTG
jgi:hypothetical protein